MATVTESTSTSDWPPFVDAWSDPPSTILAEAASGGFASSLAGSATGGRAKHDEVISHAFTEGQRAYLNLLREEWYALDRVHFEVLFAEVYTDHGTSELVTRIEARFRYLWFERNDLCQSVHPVPAEVLEAERLTALAQETVRAGYRLTARPFVHSDRWWEPEYVPDGAADERLFDLQLVRGL